MLRSVFLHVGSLILFEPRESLCLFRPEPLLHVFTFLKPATNMCKFIHDGPEVIPSSGAVLTVERDHGYPSTSGLHSSVEPMKLKETPGQVTLRHTLNLIRNCRCSVLMRIVVENNHLRE